MSLSEVIFQLNNNNYPYMFDRARLKLGAPVYVEFDDNGHPKDFYSHFRVSTIAFYVMWIVPSKWYVLLQDSFKLDNSFEKRVLESVNGYLGNETVARALAIAVHEIRPEHMFKTSEFNNSRLGVISTVVDRLVLCSRLSEEQTAKQLFHHYTPLVVYLLLTCFDRLGQPSDWLDFGSWLKSGAKQKEREQVISDGLKDASDIAISFYDTYNRIYGVSNSFFRFLHEILPGEWRQELLDSIWIEIADNPPDRGKNRQADDEAKEKYLFKLRNDYTHKAQYVPGTTTAIWPEGSIDKGIWISVQQTIGHSNSNTLMVRNWPETIERVVRFGLAQYIERIVLAEKSA